MKNTTSDAASTDTADDLVIEAQPFEQAPTDLWIGGVKAGACSTRAVVCYLALRHLGADANFRISRQKLADRQGITKRTVDAALDELVEKGWLLITPCFRETGDRQQSSNRYTLLWTPIRSKSDERLLRHKRAVEVFESDMDVRQKANLMRDEEAAALLGTTVAEIRRARKGRQGKAQAAPVQETAPGETGHGVDTCLQETARGTVQDSARGPVQDSAGEDPHSPTHTPSTQTRSAARSAATALVQEVETSVFSSSSVTREAVSTNTEIPADEPEGGRSAPPRCTVHGTETDLTCRGCRGAVAVPENWRRKAAYIAQLARMSKNEELLAIKECTACDEVGLRDGDLCDHVPPGTGRESLRQAALEHGLLNQDDLIGAGL